MSLDEELTVLLNRHSAENSSNTPDFILAQFLRYCLAAFDGAVGQRDRWYGIAPRPGGSVKATSTDLSR